MNLMITGACGHIGSYIVRNFLREKKVKKIVLIDSLKISKINSILEQ